MNGPRVQLGRALRGRVGADTHRALTRAARRGARRLGLGSAAIGIRLVDDAEMIDLHRRHLGTAVPTDVLSFPGEAIGLEANADEGSPNERDDEPAFASAGDIAIDWDQVERQAEGSDPGARACEAMSLLVHGLCHLVGHDHATPAQARRMLAAERQVARAVDLGHIRRDYRRRR